MRHIVRSAAIASCALLSAAAQAQQDFEIFQTDLRSTLPGEGWNGFTDAEFLGKTVLTLVLAAVLGAIIGYHPTHVRVSDTLEEIKAPKVYILYSVIGALIGTMVVKYGAVVGIVVFGIGGLIRFRTIMQSANLTGHVIFVTLVGLSCGLDLPHVAVLATAFAFVLIYVLDSRIVYRIDVKGVTTERLAATVAAYRAVLEQQGCRIVNERKNPMKERITLIFRSSHNMSKQKLAETLDTQIDPALKGAVDWEID